MPYFYKNYQLRAPSVIFLTSLRSLSSVFRVGSNYQLLAPSIISPPPLNIQISKAAPDTTILLNLTANPDHFHAFSRLFSDYEIALLILGYQTLTPPSVISSPPL